MAINNPFQISPLGDSAILISFGNVIDPEINKHVLSISQKLNANKISGIRDIVPAYSSLAIHYDIIEIKSSVENILSSHQVVTNWINKMIDQPDTIPAGLSRKIKVPVCYTEKFGVDKNLMEQLTGLPFNEIITLHTQKKYRVYMLGFLPGFAYMGEVDDRIAVPRKDQPRIKVDAGSVGIAGKQTGIYPIDSPGGWQIIGKTPLKLFDKGKSDPVLFHAGDEVEFYSISEDEFENY